MRNEKIKIIVTGGAGFIGSHLVDELVDLGYETHVVDNLQKGKIDNIHPKAIFHKVDILDTDRLKFVFEGAQYVFHLAAITEVEGSIQKPAETHETNINGTFNILRVAAAAGVRKLIFASSSAVYGEQVGFSSVEGTSEQPLSPYGLQKLVGEKYCRLFSQLYGLSTVCLRYFNVYGHRQSSEGDYALVIAKFMKLKSEGKPLTITGDGKQTRDFVHVSDVVRANILAMRGVCGLGEYINIGSGKDISVNEIAEAIGGLVSYIPARIEPKRTCANVDLAQRTLGWEPEVDFKRGIESLLQE